MVEKRDGLEGVEREVTTLVRTVNLPRFHEHFVRVTGVRLERAAYIVLARLDELGPLRVTDLAGHLGLDASTTSRHALRLEQAGLIRRRADASDARAAIVALTPKGRRARQRILAGRQAVLTDILQGWSEADVRDLARLLGRFNAGLSSFVAPPAAHREGVA